MASSFRWRGRFGGVLLSLVWLHGLAGCGVDDRQLAPSPPFAPVGGSTAAGGSGIGSWQGCEESGASGAPGASDSLCWDFAQGTEGWIAESGIALSFSHDDASSDAASGSLSVANEDFGQDTQMLTAGAYRCLPLAYAEKYSLELAALVPSQAAAGGASVELQFINVLGCQGLILAHPQVADPKALVWQHLTDSGDVPRGARSLLFRLLVGKFHSDPTFEARFDHVRLTLN